MDKRLLRSGRAPCPNCGKKGCGYAKHPHALGHKDYNAASCRYCGKTFGLKMALNEAPREGKENG